MSHGIGAEGFTNIAWHAFGWVNVTVLVARPILVRLPRPVDRRCEGLDLQNKNTDRSTRQIVLKANDLSALLRLGFIEFHRISHAFGE